MQWGILIALGVVALVVAGIVLERRARRLRTEGLRQAGSALGLAFEGDGNVDQLRALGDLLLFGLGYSKQVRNVMSGRVGTHDVKVFDYRYTTGGGKHSETRNQTVVLYPGGGTWLPDFALGAFLVEVPVGTTPSPLETMLHKIADRLGGQDIDFEASPVFSNRYLLRGPDETAIRAAFTPERRAFFEQHPGWTVEVQGGNVGIYRAQRRVKPRDLGTFLEQTHEVLRAFEPVA